MNINDVVKLNSFPNAKSIIFDYCRSIGSLLSDQELNGWIDKILSIGDPICILDGGKIIAFLLLYCNKYDTLDAYICNVYVQEDYRGHGISKLLVASALLICSARNFKEVNLDVSCNNIPAIKTYQKCGFKETLEYDKEGEHFYKMTYLL